MTNVEGTGVLVGRIVAAHRARAVRLVARWLSRTGCGDTSVAEDIVQAACLRLLGHRNLPADAREGWQCFKFYVRTTTKNYLSELKGWPNRPPPAEVATFSRLIALMSVDVREWRGAWSDDQLLGLADPVTVESAVEERERTAVLARALAGLPDDQRQAVARYVEQPLCATDRRLAPARLNIAAALAEAGYPFVPSRRAPYPRNRTVQMAKYRAARRAA